MGIAPISFEVHCAYDLLMHVAPLSIVEYPDLHWALKNLKLVTGDTSHAYGRWGQVMFMISGAVLPLMHSP